MPPRSRPRGPGGWTRPRPAVSCTIVFQIRRRVVMSDLRRAFGASSTTADWSLWPKAFMRTCCVVIGVCRVNLTPRSWHPVVRVENVEAILKAHALGKGVLVLSGHFGNWEVALPQRSRAFRNIVDIPSTSCVARCVRV